MEARGKVTSGGKEDLRSRESCLAVVTTGWLGGCSSVFEFRAPLDGRLLYPNQSELICGGGGGGGGCCSVAVVAETAAAMATATAAWSSAAESD